jgi:branched-chain amino acid transport system substrate-binding protein
MYMTLAFACVMMSFLVGCGERADRVVIGVCLSQANRAGAELALAELDQEARIPITLTGMDAGPDASFEPQEAMALARSFTANQRLVAVVGPEYSDTAIVIAPYFNRQRVPNVMTTASNPALTNIGPWSYRLCLSDAVQGPALADYAIDSCNRKRFAVIYESNEYGHRLASLFQKQVHRRGGTIMAIVPHRDRLQDDDRRLISRTLANLEAAGFASDRDAFLLIQNLSTATWLAAEIRKHRLTRFLLASDSLGGAQVAKTIATGDIELRATQLYATDPANQRSLRFAEQFQERFGSEPSARAAYAYDATHLIAMAIRSGGPSRPGVKRALDRLIDRSTPVQGATGSYLLAANHDARRPMLIGIAENGRFSSFETLTNRVQEWGDHEAVDR